MARRALPILKQLLKTPSDILSRRLTPPRSVTYMPIPADGTPRALTLIPGDDGMEAMHAPAYQAHGDMKKVPMASILKNKVGWATPVGGGGVSSLNLQLRKKLDLVKGGTYASSTATVMGLSTLASEGGYISLADIIRGKNSPKVFWVEIVPGTLRASVFLRLTIKHIYTLLLEYKGKGIAHGNLTAESIKYTTYNIRKPILTNHLDGCVDVSVDFLALKDIIQDIFDASGFKNMDTETIAFMSFLSSAHVGNKHYWFMNAIERERFFCEVGLRCCEDLKHIFGTTKAPIQIPLASTTSIYCSEFFSNNNKKMWNAWDDLELWRAVWETRNYYVHYGETSHAYNQNKRTTVTIYDAELDHFRYYPQLFPDIYDLLEKNNITYLLYNL